MNNQCSISNLFAACRAIPARYVFATCLVAVAAYAFCRYLGWAVAQLPDFNDDPFAVFKLGDASAALHLEMIPAQLFVAGTALGSVVVVLLFGHYVLTDACEYGAKLRHDEATKRADGSVNC
jgi:hypothetical protein